MPPAESPAARTRRKPVILKLSVYIYTYGKRDQHLPHTQMGMDVQHEPKLQFCENICSNMHPNWFPAKEH